MCGVAGLLNLAQSKPPNRELALRMSSMLHHRGPDGYGIYRDQHVVLAHRRLSIIDLEGGWQPMTDAKEQVWICANNEIFNYIELREELEAKGHGFHSHCDTEVILQAYLAWGNDFAQHLNGQWAVALWDTRSRRLVLSRDRAGILPLFWTVHAGVLRFASEVKALFADPAVPREFSPEGLDEALTFWAAVAPLTPFRGVQQLPPGVTAVFEPGAAEPKIVDRVWPLLSQPSRFAHDSDAAREQARVSAVRDSLEHAAKLRLRADVPVGAYLSGGLDSTILTSLIAARREVPLRTFSVEFDDAEYDETEYQKAAVLALETDHASVRCQALDVARVFPDVVWHAEAPLLRTAPAPLFLLAKLVRDSNYRVVLTGEGADEIFAGYDLFREDRVRRFWARQPESKVRPQLLQRLYPYMARSPVGQLSMAKAFFGKNLTSTDDLFYSHRTRWDTTARLKLLLSPDVRVPEGAAEERLRAMLPADATKLSPLARAQFVEVVTLLWGYLLSSQGDRMLMANSIEGRFPFLDPDVMTLADTLPDDLKLAGLQEKVALKRAFAERIPPQILKRKKQPYRAPVVKPFISPSVPAYVEEALSPEAVNAAGILNAEAVAQLFAKCRATGGERMSNTDEMAFCAALSLQLIAKDLIGGARLNSPPPAGKFGVDVDRVATAK
ncbi:MAG: asparagine synthase (glutamine-hydrolyzing) [Myxococcota bacterium]